MTAPHPNHETALMLLRAAGFDGEDIENVIGCEGSTWRAPILLLPHELDAMAAAVDAREKAMREALLNAANQFEFYRYQHMGKNPPDEAKAKTNADWRDACLAVLTGAKP